jgi:DNA-directed RNA polymerase specialized sigma24 family protein
LQEGGAPFQTTHWTVVLQAGKAESDEAARKALAIFSETYWPPLYTFVRRRGYSPGDAQDIVQVFFEHLLEQNTLSRADREKGRLRTFLLGSLQNFLLKQHERMRAIKRGGGHQLVSFDDQLIDAEAAMQVTAHLSDVNSYEIAWASSIVTRAWKNVRERFVAEGKREWVESNRLPPKAVRRSDARVQYVGLQFGKGSGEHLRFASAARECLIMKRTTLPAFFPSHSGSWSSLMGQSRQHERRFWNAPATHRLFVRLANRLRSIRWVSKKAITRQPNRHSVNRARGGASGGGARRAEMPLRTERVASFADVCCAKSSNCGL